MKIELQPERGGFLEASRSADSQRDRTRPAERRSLFARLSLAIIFTGMFGVASTLGGPVPAASAANEGWVTCYNQSNVVGVWVNVSGGRSGWATRTGTGFQQKWKYDTQSKSYSVTVGCGGTTSKWAASTSTPYYSKTWQNLACFPGWGYGFGTIYVKDRCYAG